MRVDGQDGNFTAVTTTEKGTEHRYQSKKIAVATGYYDLPNQLGVRGEDLPHVSHYYTEPYQYWNQDVVVIGGTNSSAEAALALYRNGARVTLVHRGKDLGATIKYWVRPDIENRIKAGQIQALLEARVEEITRDEVALQQQGQKKKVPAKQEVPPTGNPRDFSFFERLRW